MSNTTTAGSYAAPAIAGASQDTLALIGRVLIALLFVPAGRPKRCSPRRRQSR